MLYQPFILAGDLNVRLSLELLNKVRNPEAASSQSSTTYSGVASASAIDDDEGLAENVPMRIPSRTSRNKEKTTSEINSKLTFLPWTPFQILREIKFDKFWLFGVTKTAILKIVVSQKFDLGTFFAFFQGWSLQNIEIQHCCFWGSNLLKLLSRIIWISEWFLIFHNVFWELFGPVTICVT